VLGFSKRARAKKELLAALNVILIGRKPDREAALKSEKAKVDPLADKISGGLNAYLAALQIAESYILKSLAELEADNRVSFLKRISDKKFKDPPPIFELIAHVNHCLSVLEIDDNPLIPPGTAESFLNNVCKWFASDEKLLRRVVGYFQQATEHHRYHLQRLRIENERRLRRG
jgi:hypothetical protein